MSTGRIALPHTGHTFTGRRLTLAFALTAAVLAAAMTGALIAGTHTQTITRIQVRTQPAPLPRSALAAQHTQQGAIAGDEQSMISQETPNSWALGYQVLHYTPTTAEIENWWLGVDGTKQDWEVITTTVAWNGHRWAPQGNVTINPNGPVAGDPNAASYERFPDAP